MAKKETVDINSHMKDKFKCVHCLKVLDKAEFYNTNNLKLFSSGKMVICKKCLKEFVYISGEVDVNKFKKMLMINDYPYLEQEFKSALASPTETMGTYFKNIQLNYKSATWGHGNMDDWNNLSQIENGEIKECDFVVTSAIIDFWGKGYANDEYKFLQDYYNDLIRIYDHSLPVQINNYKNMAKTQNQANKCLGNGDIVGYEKSMKLLSLLSGDSNIKPVQESAASDKSQKGGYEMFIKRIEDEMPIFDWEKDLGHRDVIKNLLNNFFFGHLAKVLNIKNPFADEYDEEMRLFTVSDEEAEEEAANQTDFLGGEE